MRQNFQVLRYPAAVLALLIALAASAAAQNGGNLPGDLQALVNEALEANAEIKQMRGQYAASREAIRPAGALENPEIGFAVKDIPTDNWGFDREDMTQKMLELSQKFPFPGKRRLRSEMAAEQSKSEEFVYKDKINEVRARVVIAYWSLALAHANFDLTQKNKQFWEQVVQVAETRYAVGQGMQADVLQAQVELGNYLDRLLQWTQKQESFRAEVNALRSRPPQNALPRPQSLQVRSFTLKLDDLLATAEARPQLQALKTLITKQEKAVDLAKKEYLPDMTLDLAWGFRSTLLPNQKQPDMFSGRLMFSMPLWVGSKIQPKIREEQQRQGAAKDAHLSAWNMLAAAIKDRHAKLQRLARQISLFDQGIIPQARQATAASLASYQVGALPFNQLYQNQIAVFNAEMQLQEYLKDFEENWAELEWLIGQELPRPPRGKK